jgi:hypothetical protein
VAIVAVVRKGHCNARGPAVAAERIQEEGNRDKTHKRERNKENTKALV